MKFNESTIENLFSSSRRYEIPSYQRGYSWKQKLQIQDLWDDFEAVSEKNPLYLGPVIFQRASEEKKDTMLVVDGQQRITTLMLFFIAARNIAIKKNYPQASTLPSLIAFSKLATGGVSESRLNAGENVRDALDYLIREPGYDGKALRSKASVDKRKARVLKTNFLFFLDKLQSYSAEEMGDLLTKVLNYSFFLEIVVDDQMQAFDIFERTNARGLPLNIADLLKNLLFSNGAEITDLTTRWDSIVASADTRIQRVLKYFDALYNGHDTSKTVLFQHLRSTAKLIGPAVFMDEIEKFSRFFNDIYNYSLHNDTQRRFDQTGEFNRIFEDENSFKRLKRSVESLSLARVYVPIPLIYSGMKALVKLYKPDSKPYSNLKRIYLNLLSLIECYHFINNTIGTKPTNGPERIYAEAAKKLFASEDVAEAKEVLLSVKKELEKIGLIGKEAFIELFSQIVYIPTENKPLIAYIFDRFENSPFETSPNMNIFDPSSETIVNRTYEVEHISPISTWTGDDDILNSIGNLLVLTKATNKYVDNNKLDVKLKMYEEKNYDHLSMVREFCDFVQQFDKHEMSEEIISARATVLAEKAYSFIWNPKFNE